MFSSRLPPRLAPNALSRAVAEARARGMPFVDLTETNPTKVALPYPPELSRLLADPGSLRYDPEPAGTAGARAAVAASLPAASAITPDQIVLTASTSEAYSFLFRLLCDAGDEVLVPQPSYPLFDWLTRLDAVKPVPYRLDRDGGWALDRASLLEALSPRTRAVLIVSPNNPTGSVLCEADRAWLVRLASERRLPIVADEVFADYPLRDRPDAVSLLGEQGALTFTLGGLSKSAGLPQLKLAWIVASGPGALVRDALVRLSIIADTYLSVSTPVQNAAGALIAAAAPVRDAIRVRLARNLNTLRTMTSAHPAVTLLEPSGGWSAVVRVPAIVSEEEMTLRLLSEGGVLVHPGFFFDFETEAFLVVSLLPDEATFAEGCARMLRVAGTWR